MKVYPFGSEDAPAILLLPGTCCHWKGNFGHVIPLLAAATMALMKQNRASFRLCWRKQKK